MQTRATIITNTSNQPQYVVCMNYVIGQDEGRRHLMMEQEDLKDQDIPKGAIDVTSLSSPGPSHSSGYCSADEDHSYSKGETPGIQSPGTHSSIDANSQPNTPSSIHSPCSFPDGGNNNAVTPSMLVEKMQEFNSEELNIFNMIGDMLPPTTTAAMTGLPPGGHGSITDSWMTDIDDIDMMDDEQIRELSSLDANDGEGLIMKLLNDSEKGAALQQAQEKMEPSMNPGAGTPGLENLLVPPSTTVITQANVMLSSATLTNGISHTNSATTSSKIGAGRIQKPKLCNRSFIGQQASLPMSVCTGMDSGLVNHKANISVSAFPSDMLGVTTNGDGHLLEGSTNDFTLKFAETMVDQQINATLASYLGDGDSLMDSSSLGVQDTPLNGLNDSPTFNFLGEPCVTSNTLSQYLASPASSQPSCTSYQSNGTSLPLKQVQFAMPQAPPPVSRPQVSSASRQSTNIHSQSSASLSPVSKTHSQREQPSKTNVQVPPRQQQNNSYAAFPGLDDHRYTSKQLDSPPHNNHKGSTLSSHRNSHRNGHRPHKPHNHTNHHSRHSPHNSHNSHNHQPSLLEKFLLTKEKLNPNKGSDAALAAQGISQLNLGEPGSDFHDLGDGSQQLLKKLLTQEINPKEMQKAQQEVIMDRRQSAGSSPTSCSSPPLMNNFSLDPEDLAQGCIGLLGEDANSEMDKLWAPPHGDDAIPSELDDILQEEMRQNDLWLQHCINELL